MVGNGDADEVDFVGEANDFEFDALVLDVFDWEENGSAWLEGEDFADEVFFFEAWEVLGDGDGEVVDVEEFAWDEGGVGFGVALPNFGVDFEEFRREPENHCVGFELKTEDAAGEGREGFELGLGIDCFNAFDLFDRFDVRGGEFLGLVAVEEGNEVLVVEAGLDGDLGERLGVF